jgi:hypothetical protein
VLGLVSSSCQQQAGSMQAQIVILLLDICLVITGLVLLLQLLPRLLLLPPQAAAPRSWLRLRLGLVLAVLLLLILIFIIPAAIRVTVWIRSRRLGGLLRALLERGSLGGPPLLAALDLGLPGSVAQVLPVLALVGATPDAVRVTGQPERVRLDEQASKLQQHLVAYVLDHAGAVPLLAMLDHGELGDLATSAAGVGVSLGSGGCSLACAAGAVLAAAWLVLLTAAADGLPGRLLLCALLLLLGACRASGVMLVRAAAAAAVL